MAAIRTQVRSPRNPPPARGAHAGAGDHAPGTIDGSCNEEPNEQDERMEGGRRRREVQAQQEGEHEGEGQEADGESLPRPSRIPPRLHGRGWAPPYLRFAPLPLCGRRSWRLTDGPHRGPDPRGRGRDPQDPVQQGDPAPHRQAEGEARAAEGGGPEGRRQGERGRPWVRGPEVWK